MRGGKYNFFSVNIAYKQSISNFKSKKAIANL